MPPNQKNNRGPVPSIIHQMAFKRLFTRLRSILAIEDLHFEPELTLMLKGVYFKYNFELYQENSLADVAAFISRGLGFMHYHHPGRGKVVTEIFGAGDIVLNPDSFFNGKPADTGLTFIEDTNILFLNHKDLNVIFDGFEEAKMLTIKTLAGMFSRIRSDDEMSRLNSKMKIRLFFEKYAILLKPARQAPMQYKDIASYLNIDQFHFSTLMKEIYPVLNN